MAGFDWMFEVVDHATAPIKAMSTSIDLLTAATAKNIAAIDKLSEHLGHLGKAHEEAKHHSEGLLGKLLEFEAVKEAFSIVVEGVHKIVEVFIDAEKEANNFERGLKKFGEQGEIARETVEKFGKYSNLTNEQVEKFSLGLVKAGFRGKELEPIFASIADIKFLGGDADAAAKAWEKLGTTGKLSSKSLKDFGISVEDVAATLGPGKTAVDAEKLFKSHDITKVADTVLATMRRVNSGLGLAAGKDLDLGDIVEKFQGLPKEIAKAFSSSPELKSFKADLFSLFETLSKKENIEKFVAAIRTIGAVISFIAPAIPPIVLAITAMSVALAIAGISFAVAFSPVILTVGAVALAIGAVGVAIYEVIEYWDDIKSAAGAAADYISEAAGKIWKSIKEAFGAATDAIGDFLTWELGLPGRFFKGALEIGSSIIDGIAKGLTAGITAVEDAVTNVASAVKDKFKNFLGIHSPSTVFAELGDFSAQGFAKGLTEGMQDVDANATLSVDALRSKGSSEGSSVGSNGGNNYTFGDITIEVSLQGSTSSAEEIGERIKEVAPGMLISAISRLAQQQGVKSA